MKNVPDSAGPRFVLEATDAVLPCPFCGEADFETDLVELDCGIALRNTHTASYWVECGCGAVIHGEYFDARKKPVIASHRRAAASALSKWNKRVAA